MEPPQPNPTPATPNVPTMPQANPTSQPPMPESNSKVKLILILSAFVVILVGVGYYLYQLNMNQVAQNSQKDQDLTKEVQAMEPEINSLEIGTTDSEFAEVDKDISGL